MTTRYTERIAEGDEPALQSGTAEWYGEWSRPNRLDYEKAMNVLSAQDKCRD